MSKAQTVTKNNNIFSLRSIHPNCHVSSVAVDFTAPVNPTKPSQCIAPIFLGDGKSFTPSFVLPFDQAYYARNCGYEKAKFTERVLKALQLQQDLEKDEKQNPQISLAIPSSTFCQVCKTNFVCYESHIKSNDHLIMAQQKIATNYIHQMCSQIKTKRDKKVPDPKNKKIKKQAKKKVRTIVHRMETRSKKKQSILTQSSKVINLNINTMCSAGNNY